MSPAAQLLQDLFDAIDDNLQRHPGHEPRTVISGIRVRLVADYARRIDDLIAADVMDAHQEVVSGLY